MQSLIPMEDAESLADRKSRGKASKNCAATGKALIKIPGYGEKTKEDHAKSIGVNVGTWYDRYKNWKNDGNTEKLMKTKEQSIKDGQAKGRKTWRKVYGNTDKS